MRLISLAAGAIALGSAVFLSLASTSPQAAAPATASAPATSKTHDELVARANAFVQAFAKEDVNALAAFWAPEGDYVDLTGRSIVGRDAIAKDFAELFAENEGLTLRIEVTSIRTPTPDTAVEDGVTSVLAPDGGVPSRARYTNSWVKRDGTWYLVSVRESAYVPPSHYEHLRPLEWVIGEWVQDTKDPHALHVSFQWTPDQNYILVSRTVLVGKAALDGGSERIGWDPAAKLVRSWSFEPDGGFGQSTWKRDGNVWRTGSSSVLASGSLMTSAGVLTRVDANTVTWQATNQVIDGKPVPDSAVITMRRVD
ncbi:MAG: SgcJ/EcaC family oxidoreductase [Phycisphaerae bacterium]|nr:SgcJ/EcaC family oxidoreductase [Phycisphaerae bacterium]